MGVPAGLAQNVLALHGLIAGDEVLDGAGFDMADVGLAVGRGRAVEEGEFLAALAVLDGLFKDVVLLPEMDGLDFALDEIEIRGDFFKHATTPPKNTPRPEFGTRSSRYHPSWRKAPARGAQKRACAVTGGPGAAYWQERSACRSGAIPSAPFRRARTSPGSLGKGERGGSPLQGVSTNIITGSRHL